MVCLSFHIYVCIYSGSSRSKQAMASWSRKKKEQRLKMNITNRDFHGLSDPFNVELDTTIAE